MDAEEDAYLLALCDDALSQEGLRGHALPWLREGGDPSGPPARVDAWYPQLRVIVLLTHRRDEDRSLFMAEAGRPYDVDVFEVPRGWVERDAAGALRRLPAERRRIRRLLGTPDAREANRVTPAVAYTDIGYTQYVEHDDGNEDEDEYEDEYEDEDQDDEWDDEEKADLVDPGLAADALGWRGRSVALALLEAVRLARRAFEVRRAGSGLSEPALEALLVLLAAGPPGEPFRPFGPQELGQLLVRDPDEVGRALAELEAAGHARCRDDGLEPADPDHLVEWTLTASGHETAVAWIARVIPLFAGWPRDVPGVDDADTAPDR